MKIAIVGAGDIGRAIGHLVDKNGHECTFFDKDGSRSDTSIELALNGAEIVFFCVPSWGLRDALLSAKENMVGTEMLVFISKGLEPKTGLNVMEVAASAAPGFRTAFIGGPMLAEEIMDGKGGAGVIASSDRRVMETVRAAISSDEFLGSVSEDVVGTVFSGVLKNVYALLLGSAEGLGYGINMKGVIASRAIKEMRSIVQVLGGSAESVSGLAGIGDLFATGYGNLSANWSAGFALAQGGHPEKISEGMSSFPGIASRVDISKFELLSAAGDIILKNDNDKLRRIFQS